MFGVKQLFSSILSYIKNKYVKDYRLSIFYPRSYIYTFYRVSLDKRNGSDRGEPRNIGEGVNKNVKREDNGRAHVDAARNKKGLEAVIRM